LVKSRSREQFVGEFAHPFLLALGAIEPSPHNPARTHRFGNSGDLKAALDEARKRLADGESSPAVLAVKKSIETFPSMITVGRARNNDIVVPEALVSKFHAFFRPLDGGWSLADAGSVNGTFIEDKKLPPKGAPEAVAVGNRVTFGSTAFQFVDAAGLWAALNAP
jgi:hypothetical protein